LQLLHQVVELAWGIGNDLHARVTGLVLVGPDTHLLYAEVRTRLLDGAPNPRQNKRIDDMPLQLDLCAGHACAMPPSTPRQPYQCSTRPVVTGSFMPRFPDVLS